MRLFGFLLMGLSLFAQSSTYLGPRSPVAGLIRVEVLIQDSLDLGGATIQSASFAGRTIPLKPADVNGYRGGASFQEPPGKYSLQWVVMRDKSQWPRKVNHQQDLLINPKDEWIQITIVGEEASIR